MVDSADDFFYNNFIESSMSEESSDDDTDILVATLLVNDHFERQRLKFRGSIPGHAPALDRNRERGHLMLYDDYFQPKPLFPPRLFWHRFRMCKRLFNRIWEGVTEYDDYFKCKYDCTGKVGFSSYQKCTTAIRMLAYGVPGDLVDEYVRYLSGGIVHTLSSCGSGVWSRVLAATKCRGYSLVVGDQCC